MRFRGWRETAQQAETALVMAKDRNQGPILRWLKTFLLRLQYNGSRAYFHKNPDAIAVCWNGLNGTRRVFMQGAKDAGARRLFFELAPLPGRITVDPCGVNFANCLPRVIKPYKVWHQDHTHHDWRSIGQQIRQRKAKASSTGATATPPLSEPFLFVPLQTPGDSQLRLFGGEFKTVENFISAITNAAQHLPEGWHIRIKEHPTSPTSFAERIIATAPDRVFLDNTNDTFSQVAASRGVVTVNSSVGLEAMFYEKPVVACGECFWAINDVAIQAKTTADLTKLFKSANEWSFDPTARAAFLTFLDKAYYPRMHEPEDFPLIAARLDGKMDFSS